MELERVVKVGASLKWLKVVCVNNKAVKKIIILAVQQWSKKERQEGPTAWILNVLQKLLPFQFHNVCRNW